MKTSAVFVSVMLVLFLAAFVLSAVQAAAPGGGDPVMPTPDRSYCVKVGGRWVCKPPQPARTATLCPSCGMQPTAKPTLCPSCGFQP